MKDKWEILLIYIVKFFFVSHTKKHLYFWYYVVYLYFELPVLYYIAVLQIFELVELLPNIVSHLLTYVHSNLNSYLW